MFSHTPLLAVKLTEVMQRPCSIPKLEAYADAPAVLVRRCAYLCHMYHQPQQRGHHGVLQYSSLRAEDQESTGMQHQTNPTADYTLIPFVTASRPQE